MTKIGEVGIVIEDTKVWTNSVEVAQRMRDEERRKTWRKQKGIQGKDHRGWSEVMKDGMMREMDRREIGEVNEISEESTSGILIIGENDDMQVYYVDSNGECWDEITNKKLNQEGVRKARLDEMKQIYQHNVYTKVPERMCIEKQGESL